MSSHKPVISVLMAVYNTPPEYLEAAVESILAQSFTDFEFLIVDDGSDEETRYRLNALASMDRRIQLHSLTVNVGLTCALNEGLRLARGAYIARQDADDLSMPDRLGSILNFMEMHPELSGVGTFAILIGPDGTARGKICTNLHELEHRNVLVHGSMMFRREAIEQIGGYNEQMRLSQDYEVYLRMTRMHGMCLGVIPETLYALRQHTTSLSSSRLFRQFYFSVLAKSLTLPQKGKWSSKLSFLKIFVMDFLFTHRLLMGPMLRKVLNSINHNRHKNCEIKE